MASGGAAAQGYVSRCYQDSEDWEAASGGEGATQFTWQQQPQRTGRGDVSGAAAPPAWVTAATALQRSSPAHNPRQHQRLAVAAEVARKCLDLGLPRPPLPQRRQQQQQEHGSQAAAMEAAYSRLAQTTTQLQRQGGAVASALESQAAQLAAQQRLLLDVVQGMLFVAAKSSSSAAPPSAAAQPYQPPLELGLTLQQAQAPRLSGGLALSQLPQQPLPPSQPRQQQQQVALLHDLANILSSHAQPKAAAAEGQHRQLQQHPAAAAAAPSAAAPSPRLTRGAELRLAQRQQQGADAPAPGATGSSKARPGWDDSTVVVKQPLGGGRRGPRLDDPPPAARRPPGASASLAAQLLLKELGKYRAGMQPHLPPPPKPQQQAVAAAGAKVLTPGVAAGPTAQLLSRRTAVRPVGVPQGRDSRSPPQALKQSAALKQQPAADAAEGRHAQLSDGGVGCNSGGDEVARSLPDASCMDKPGRAGSNTPPPAKLRSQPAPRPPVGLRECGVQVASQQQERQHEEEQQGGCGVKQASVAAGDAADVLPAALPGAGEPVAAPPLGAEPWAALESSSEAVVDSLLLGCGAISDEVLLEVCDAAVEALLLAEFAQPACVE